MPRERRQFTAARDAHKYAVTREREYSDQTFGTVPYEMVPQELMQYFFPLQERVEKGERTNPESAAEKGMDYHEYAALMWQELVGIDAPDAQKRFELDLMYRLQHIPMKEYVYPEVTASMVELIERYGESIASVGIWSTGDVDATGYQISKIMRSNVVGTFQRAVFAEARKNGKTSDEVGRFFREKTRYQVDNDKISALVQSVQQWVVEAEQVADLDGTEHSSGKVRLVIVEDSRNAFEKVRKGLNAAGLEGRYELYPIWATYSREGQVATQKAEGDVAASAELAAQMHQLHAIQSFDDLLHDARFEKAFDNAHLFIDFDGVIGDNVEMRKQQVEQTYSALIAAAGRVLQKPREEITEMMLERVTRAP